MKYGYWNSSWILRILVSTTALILLVSAAPSLGADGLTLLQLSKLRSVTEAVISPDGSLIATVLDVPRVPGKDKDGPSWKELHLVDAKTGESRPFITGEVNVRSVQWAGGMHLSYLAKRGEDKYTSLYMIAVNGGESKRKLSLESSIESYAWSVDLTAVAVIASEPRTAEEKKLREQGFTQEVYEEDWKPRRVYIASAFDSMKPRRMMIQGAPFQVRWSPDGQRIAVGVSRTPLVDDRYMTQQVQVVDVETDQVHSTLENEGKLGTISWSPDGRHIAIISGEDLNDPAAGRLLVSPASGGALTDPLGGHLGHVSQVGWLDDATLLFINDSGVWTSFERIGIDGQGRKTIVETGGPAMTSLSLSQDGRHAAFIASSPQHPSEAFAMSHGDSAPRRMTESNPWLDEVSLARQELVRFKARDGLELEGLLIRPLGEQPGTRYPLVLMVHGGPESHHRNGWLTTYSNPGQVVAAREMAVLYTNYRGSTGRGVGFSELSQADPAGKEFDDLVDAVDHLIDAGLVDKDRVGVTGGSYGGYATAWCSTYYSDRFAAGVMFVGISNKISKVGTTDIPNEEYHVHARKRPWDNWQMFLERSPVYYAGQAKTPLLILHGKDDPRVNVGQSRELYRHLKLRGQAPVRLVLYPGEGHGNRRAASRFDYSLRSLRWLEHYLKGPGGDPPPYQIAYSDPGQADIEP